jgi:predicted LPLAT superfamily acyltransferase
LIAAVLQAPVMLAFGLFRGGNRYDLVFESFSGPIHVARQDRIRVLGDMARRYAARLEHHARSAPYNWFNFYDYWLTSQPTDGASSDDQQARTQDGLPDRVAGDASDGGARGRVGRAA